MVSSSASPSMTVDISFLHVGDRRLQAWIDSPAAGAAPRVGEGESHEAAIGNALRMPRLAFETAIDELDAIRAHERNRTLIVQVRPHHQMRCLGTRHTADGLSRRS